MSKKIKSAFMGMCASLIVLVIVAVFNTALKPASDSLFASLQPTPTTIAVTTTPAVLGEQAATQSGEVARVKRVVDGDTMLLEDGRKVRFIGIDTPESVKPNTPEQCFSKAAAERNKELVEGKDVTLIKDVSDKDRFQRLLRYVYVGDVFVNAQLVKEGFAFARSYPPDISKQDELRQYEAEARANNVGLWGSCEIIPKGSKGESQVGN